MLLSRLSPLSLMLLMLLLIAMPVLASHDKSDIVTLDDGSILIGEIKSVQYATLSLHTSAAGTLAIEWRRITSITSKFEYRIEISGGQRYFGSFEKTAQPGYLLISDASGEVEFKLEDIFQIVPIEQGFWKRLDGSVNFGFSYTQANSAVQYNLSGDASYRTRKNWATLSAQSIFNSQEDGQSTQQNYAQLILAQVTSKKWGTFEVGQIQSNPDQGYDLRVVAGGGAANFLVESSREIVALNLGAVYNREQVTDSSDVDNSAEALAGISYRHFKRDAHSPNLNVGLQTFTSLTESSRYRAVFSFNLSWKIIGDLKFSFQVNDYYDSKPPGEDATKNDMSIVTSVGYIF